jgi:transposase
MKKKNNFSAAFKAKVACAALRENKSINELSAEHGVHKTQINKWRKTVTENSATLFDTIGRNKSSKSDINVAELQRIVGEQTIQLAWYKKKLGHTN